MHFVLRIAPAMETARRLGGLQLRRRDQLSELPEVLDGCGEKELVTGTARASQSQPVEAQDALEVGEQHLDLLSLTPRGRISVGLRDIARHVPRALIY